MPRRLQIILPDTSMTRLESLVEKTEASTMVEVIRNALRLYEAAVDAKTAGGDVVIHNPNGTTMSAFM